MGSWKFSARPVLSAVNRASQLRVWGCFLVREVGCPDGLPDVCQMSASAGNNRKLQHGVKELDFSGDLEDGGGAAKKPLSQPIAAGRRCGAESTAHQRKKR